MQHINLKFLTFFFIFIFSLNSEAVDRRGRLGVGLSNQLKNSIPSLSFKLQRSQAFAIGGEIGYNSDDADGGYGAALKLYRNFFQEPQLVFYGSLLAGLIERSTGGVEEDGFQVDLALGSEFSFTGLNSIGFSFEFGISMNKLDDFVIETIGNNFIVSSIHFYL